MQRQFICRHAVEYGSNGIAAAALAAILLSSGPAAAAGPLAVFEGPARIVDGDTLYIGTEKVKMVLFKTFLLCMLQLVVFELPSLA